MGFLLDTQATRSALMSVATTLAENIDATQDYIPVASTANFSTSVVAEVESTNEVVSFDSITTNKNLYSQDFDNAYWTKRIGSISANAGVAPDGTTTADNFVPTTGNVNNHFVSRSMDVPGTLSVFAKPNGYNFINLIMQKTAADSQGAQFNISTGVVVTTQNATASISDAGNGWYRCSINASGGSNTIIFQPNDGSTPNTSDYFRSTFAGDGSSGGLMWGAQVENLTPYTLTGYLPTTSASLSGLTNVTRGVNGTTAASATSGDSIQQLPYALLNVDMPVRLQGLSVSSDGTGAGRLTLCDNNGDTLCDVDIPDTKIFDLTFDGGILFPNGIFFSNSDNITAYTLYTDKYSGDSL